MCFELHVNYVCLLHSTPEKVLREQAFTAVVGFGKMTKKDKGLPAVVGNFFNPWLPPDAQCKLQLPKALSGVVCVGVVRVQCVHLWVYLCGAGGLGFSPFLSAPPPSSSAVRCSLKKEILFCLLSGHAHQRAARHCLERVSLLMIYSSIKNIRQMWTGSSYVSIAWLSDPEVIWDSFMKLNPQRER